MVERAPIIAQTIATVSKNNLSTLAVKNFYKEFSLDNSRDCLVSPVNFVASPHFVVPTG